MPGAGRRICKSLYLPAAASCRSFRFCLSASSGRSSELYRGGISRALKYWSNEGLLILETDPSGELTGITLTEPSPDTQMELTATVSVPQSALAATAPISQTVSAATVSVPASCTGSRCSYFADGICSHCFHATAGYCTVQICLCSHPSPNQGA